MMEKKEPRDLPFETKRGMFSPAIDIFLLKIVANSSMTALILTWKMTVAKHQPSTRQLVLGHQGFVD